MHTLTLVQELSTTEIDNKTLVYIEVFCSCGSSVKYNRYVNTETYESDPYAVLSNMGDFAFTDHAKAAPVVKATVVSTREMTASEISNKLNEMKEEPANEEK